MKGVYIYPYKAGLNSSALLSAALGVKRISHNNSTFRGNENKVVINWGASVVSEEVGKCLVLNKPQDVRVSVDKVLFLEKASRLCRVPPFTGSTNEAIKWLLDGYTVVERHVTQGYGGAGIRIARNVGELQVAPLYTRYIKKKSEWRVHIVGGQVVDVQRKCRNLAVPDDKVNWEVRNLEGGFIYARGDARGNIPDDVIRQAMAAMVSVEVDFGAVDVVYNERADEAYVLEINTAPGLSEELATLYAEGLANLVHRKVNGIVPLMEWDAREPNF